MCNADLSVSCNNDKFKAKILLLVRCLHSVLSYCTVLLLSIIPFTSHCSWTCLFYSRRPFIGLFPRCVSEKSLMWISVRHTEYCCRRKLQTCLFYAVITYKYMKGFGTSGATSDGKRTQRRHVLNEEKWKEIGARHARFTKPTTPIVM